MVTEMFSLLSLFISFLRLSVSCYVTDAKKFEKKTEVLFLKFDGKSNKLIIPKRILTALKFPIKIYPGKVKCTTSRDCSEELYASENKKF